MFFKTFWRLAAVGVWCGGVLAFSTSGTAADQEIQGEVIKRAGDTNPSLCLASFQGPEEVRQKLLRTLKQCDWFTITTDPQADYTVNASYSGGSLAIQVAGRATLSFTQPAADTAEWTVFRAVDSLITQAFNKRAPFGLCATTMAFAVGSGGRGAKELFTCNFDGSNVQQLTHNNSISTEPSWGPTVSSLVYTLYNHNCTDVALVDPLRKRQRALSQSPGLNSGAAMAASGDWVALTLSRDRQVELYIMHVATRKLIRLTRDAAVESSPCWSPGGGEICYVSDRGGKPRLYLIPARGGEGRPLSRGAGAESVSPDWSKQTNKICFATGGGGNYQLALLDMATPGAAATLIKTDRGGSYESPSWLPDGRHVVCTRLLGRNSRELCMVNTETGKVTKILDAHDTSLPAASPLH